MLHPSVCLRRRTWRGASRVIAAMASLRTVTVRELRRGRPFATVPSAVPPTAAVRDGFQGLVGHTPLFRLRKISEETGCEVLGKAEWLNPGGSVKDRTASFLVEDAVSRGLKPGGTVVEGTAGNTGIGLAHICNARGFKCVIFMPDTQSREKSDLLRALGADVRAVPAVPISDSKHFTFRARDYAAATPGAFWANQFDNPANAAGHYATTGPEIWAQAGGRVDAFVCATGTGGTLAGTARFLAEASGGRTRVFLADPPGSALHGFVSSGGAKLERSGSSITEGEGRGGAGGGRATRRASEAFYSSSFVDAQASGRAASRTTCARRSPSSPALSSSRTRGRSQPSTASSATRASSSARRRRSTSSRRATSRGAWGPATRSSRWSAMAPTATSRASSHGAGSRRRGCSWLFRRTAGTS